MNTIHKLTRNNIVGSWQGGWLEMVLVASARIIRSTPESLTRRLCWGASWFFLILPSGERRKADLNIKKIFALPKHSIFARMFVRQFSSVQLLIALESIVEIIYPGFLKIKIDPAQVDILQSADKNRGILVCTAHLGAWEILARIIQQLVKRDMSVLAKEPRSWHTTEALTRLRSRLGVKLIWNHSASVLKDMLLQIKKNGVIGVVMDQKPAMRRGVLCPFMGFDTEFVSGPAAIARRASAPVYSTYCVRVGPRNYRVLIDKVCEDASLIDEEELTRSIVKSMEAAIQNYPEQWTWTYKRWKFD